MRTAQYKQETINGFIIIHKRETIKEIIATPEKWEQILAQIKKYGGESYKRLYDKLLDGFKEFMARPNRSQYHYCSIQTRTTTRAWEDFFWHLQHEIRVKRR